jgi:hypothetical protein
MLLFLAVAGMLVVQVWLVHGFGTLILTLLLVLLVLVLLVLLVVLPVRVVCFGTLLVLPVLLMQPVLALIWGPLVLGLFCRHPPVNDLSSSTQLLCFPSL